MLQPVGMFGDTAATAACGVFGSAWQNEWSKIEMMGVVGTRTHTHTTLSFSNTNTQTQTQTQTQAQKHIKGIGKRE